MGLATYMAEVYVRMYTDVRLYGWTLFLVVPEGKMMQTVELLRFYTGSPSGKNVVNLTDEHCVNWSGPVAARRT